MRSETGLLTCALLPDRLPGDSQWPQVGRSSLRLDLPDAEMRAHSCGAVAVSHRLPEHLMR
jgi:hypothetical protein